VQKSLGPSDKLNLWTKEGEIQLHKIESVFRKIENAFVLLAGLIAMCAMLLVVLDVAMRTIFNNSLVAITEIVTSLFVGIVALGFSYVQSNNKNIVVEVATESLPSAYKKILDIAGYVIGICVIGIVVWTVSSSTWNSFVAGDYSMGLISIPIWPTKLVLTLGVFLLLVRLIWDFINIIADFRKEEDEAVSLNKEPSINLE